MINMDENKSCLSRFCADKSEITNSLGEAEFSLLLGAALVTLCHSPWQQALGEGQSAVGGACSTAALIYAHTCCSTHTHSHE